jgi:hypothetical protein
MMSGRGGGRSELRPGHFRCDDAAYPSGRSRLSCPNCPVPESITFRAPSPTKNVGEGLAVSGRTRSQLAPELPTIAEAGYADEVEVYNVVAALAGLPDSVAALLESLFAARATSPMKIVRRTSCHAGGLTEPSLQPSL